MVNFWSENIDILWHLAQAYNQDSLTVFAGAGVSRSCGLPLWPDLVRELRVEVARRTFPDHGTYGTYDDPKGWGGLIAKEDSLRQEVLASFPLPIQSRYCKSRLGKGYKRALQSILYNRSYYPSPIVAALSQLIKLKAVCTYNYDDILESTAIKRSFVSISGPEKERSYGVPVYHVHGLLPSKLKRAPKGDLVFSEDEYHSIYMDFGHWSNLIQLALLLESECILFLGLSFEDPNLRRVLDAARNVKKNPQLFNICKLPFSRPISRISDQPLSREQAELEVLNAVYREIGVTNLWVDNFEPDINFVLEAIGKDDPIEHYTNQWRRFLTDQLAVLPRDGKCVACDERSVKGFDGCPNHTLGDKTRFSQYAPIPKTLTDKCQLQGCDMISAGLSGKCVEHLTTHAQRIPKA